MMRSLYSGVSGLKSHQTRMDVIGNNISNVNTTGFKSGRTTFADTLSQTLTAPSAPNGNMGGTNAKQVGLGVGVASIDTIFTDGSVQATGKNTDLCITGNGLFVVKRGNETFYTRDGAFEFDAEGNYVLPGSGLYVQGWMAKDGVLSTSSQPTNITVQAGKSMAATATTLVTYTNNLNAAAPTVKSISGGEDRVDELKTFTSPDDGEAIAKGTPYDVNLYLKSVTDPVNVTSGTYKVGGVYKVVLEPADPAPSFTPTADVKAKITLEDGSKNFDTISNGYGTEGTTYTLGSDLSVTHTDNTTSETASATHRVLLKFEDGTSTTEELTSGTYKVGDRYGDKTIKTVTAKVKITGITEEYTIEKMEQNQIVKAKATTDNPITLTMSDGSILTENSGTFKLGQSEPVTTILTAYDTLGNKHSIPVYFTKTKTDSSTGNEWTVSVATDGSGDAKIEEADGSITKVHMDDVKLSFTTEGKYAGAEPAGQTLLTLSNGATGEQKVNLELTQLTQYAAAKSTVNGKENGNAAGTLSTIDIDSTGTITATYTNGIKQVEAQVAMAQFTNASGLTKTGNSLYQESNNSGKANVKTADALGVNLTPSSLEMSNVDVANELTDMIVTQRGFQTNSKIITVSDEMLEQVINMKR